MNIFYVTNYLLQANNTPFQLFFEEFALPELMFFENVSLPPRTNVKFIIIRLHFAMVCFIPLTCPYEIIHASRRHIVPRGSGRISGEHKMRRKGKSFHDLMRADYNENISHTARKTNC